MENETQLTVHEVEQGDNNPIQALMLNPSMLSNVDTEKLQALFNLYVDNQKNVAEQKFNKAFTKMQAKLPRIAEKGKTNNSKYALMEDIIDVCRPILEEYGFSTHFDFLEKDNKVAVNCTVIHEDGFSRKTTTPFLPYDASGNKNAIQAVGSAMSYGKKYAFVAAFNISSGDDDGVAAGSKPWKPTAEMRERLVNAYRDADVKTQETFVSIYGEIHAGGFDKWLSTCKDAVDFQQRIVKIEANKEVANVDNS